MTRFLARFNGDDRAFLLPEGFRCPGSLAPRRMPGSAPILPGWIQAKTVHDGVVWVNLEQAYVVEKVTNNWAGMVERAERLVTS